MSHPSIQPACAIRTGRPSDADDINSLLDAWEMGGDFEPTEFLVAESEGRIAGVARVDRMDGYVWLHPIAVAAGYQRQGVGSALLEGLLRQHGSIRVVARGASVPFYAHLGFFPTEWDEVASSLKAECDGCTDAAECRPVPMCHRGLQPTECEEQQSV
ncbi:MAG: GNAT family N-acetyltransferase [Coriobacteriia bacterium]|nr:GNAT family N-acetyltransferase [Coriobacteriia bacterium]